MLTLIFMEVVHVSSVMQRQTQRREAKRQSAHRRYHEKQVAHRLAVVCAISLGLIPWLLCLPNSN